MKLSIIVSVGEIVDKLTILKIKREKIVDSEKLIHINNEINELESTLSDANIPYDDLAKELYEVNLTLWTIEDDIRVKEKEKLFDQSFIELARSVYQQNDLRFHVKDRINQKYGSYLREVKSYEKY